MRRSSNHYLNSAEYTFLFITTNGQASADTDKRRDTVRDQTYCFRVFITTKVMQNTISERTTRWTLKQMGYSSRRPHRVPLLSAKNRKRRLHHTGLPKLDKRRLEKTLPGLMSLDFCCDIQTVESEFDVKTWKHGSILPCINGSGWCWCWWWWCNGVGDIFWAHFGPLRTNWASFKRHNLPDYCCWPCPSLYDYSVPIFGGLLPAG